MTVAHPFRFPSHLKLNCSTKTRSLMRHRDISTIRAGPGRTGNLLRAHTRGPAPESGRKRSHAADYQPGFVSPMSGITQTEIVPFRKVAGLCVRLGSPLTF